MVVSTLSPLLLQGSLQLAAKIPLAPFSTRRIGRHTIRITGGYQEMQALLLCLVAVEGRLCHLAQACLYGFLSCRVTWGGNLGEAFVLRVSHKHRGLSAV